jgi:hypothetical protein
MLVISLTLGSIASFAGLACGSPDSTTHVGKLTSIDKNTGEFTIMDMMLSTPISFEADAQLLSNLENMKGTIEVDFEDEGDKLKALEVRQ